MKSLFPELVDGFLTDMPNTTFTILTLIFHQETIFPFCFSWLLLLHHLQITGRPRNSLWQKPLKFISQFQSLPTHHTLIEYQLFCYTYAVDICKTSPFFLHFHLIFVSSILLVNNTRNMVVPCCLTFPFPYFIQWIFMILFPSCFSKLYLPYHLDIHCLNSTSHHFSPRPQTVLFVSRKAPVPPHQGFQNHL